MNQSHLRIAVGWREMSFCQFQIQQGTFNKPVTAVRKHSFQGVRSNKNMIRPISPRTQSEMRQTTAQTQSKWEKWCPELHRRKAFPQPFHLLSAL